MVIDHDKISNFVESLPNLSFRAKREILNVHDPNILCLSAHKLE